MYEQLDIFSYLEPHTENTIFNPIEEFAKHGSGFVNGKKRIIDFFAENENLTDRANFLKKEYPLIISCLIISQPHFPTYLSKTQILIRYIEI